MIDWNLIDLSDFNKRQKKELLKQAVKTANKRLRNFREKGLESSAIKKAKKYLKDEERKTFSSSKRTLEKNLEAELSQVVEFLQSETSTLTGFKEKEIEYGRRIAEINNISLTSEKDFKDFYEFVHSTQYLQMRSIIGSPILIDDYLNKLDSGFSKKDIEKAFKDYQEGNISLMDYLTLEKNTQEF